MTETALERPRAISHRARRLALRRRILHVLGWTLLAVVAVVPALWVLFLAPTTGKWATAFGSAVHDPRDFWITMLNGITAAALYFVVASGFTLIFGLMRVVNMAHGAFFLFGGYVALKLQRNMVGEGGGFGLTSSQVNLTHWIVPAIVATVVVAAMGVTMQQVFLRWNQGQDLRQALITIAIAIILADQMLAHFGGVAEDIAWPRNFDKFVNLRVEGIQYTATRLIILGIALAIGLLLWVWLKRTRTGMVIRAGVDDRAMVSALGINIQLTFAIAFAVGSGLAGLGGVIGGSFASLAPGVDANWLLYSLVAVIIGGMGSLAGAADGVTPARSDEQLRRRVPTVELHVLLDHLHLRARRTRARSAAARTFREGGMRPVTPDRVVGAVALVAAVLAPLFLSTYWVGTLLTQMLLLGIVAASLIFLSAYGGMVSLAQVALFGVAGFVVGNATTNGNTKGLNLGWNPWWGVAARARRDRAGRPDVRRDREPQRRDLLPDDHADVLGDREPDVRSGHRRLGLRRDQRHPHAGCRSAVSSAHPNRLYYVALVVSLVIYVLLRYLARTPFGLTLQGVRDDPVRMGSLGYNVVLHRTIAFAFAAFVAAIAGVLFVWWNGHIDPASIDLGATIDVLVIAVIGGLFRLEGAWVGALFFVVINNYSQQISFIGPRFHTLIGAIFLVIVLVSPGGLIGLWERAVILFSGRAPRPDRPEPDRVGQAEPSI